MSLDKQRILSELGSVMNQLQSADCGCMGKLFNGGQAGCGGPTGNPLPTCGGCRRGSCPGHGYGVHYGNMSGSGEPFAMNAGGMTGGGMPGGNMAAGGLGGMHGGMPGGMPGEMHGGMPGGMHGGMPGGLHGGMPGGMPGGMHGGMPGGMHGGMHGGTQDEMHGGMHEGMHGGMHEGMHGGMPKGMHNGLQGGMQGMGGGMNSGGMPFGGMGQNAPRLYADTYNYLNKNMMQPVMQEVYNDLKSITPENTIASNPLANKMGLSMNQGNAGMGGQMPTSGANMPGAPGNPMTNHNTPQMGGLGANIVNMMMSGGGGTPNNMPQGGQLKDSMLIDAPHSPHGQVGLTPLGNKGMSGMNPSGALGNPNNANIGGMPMNQGNPAAMMQNPTTQYVTQNNMHEVNAMPQGNVVQGGAMMQQRNAMTPQGNAMPQGNLTSGNNNMPGMMKNMGQPGRSPYGQHSAGIKKFNEMFPGVMQGDLNFDPMAIAVQMNPANQKQAAIDTMTKLMNGNKGQAMMQPAIAGANTAVQQISSQGGQQQMVQGQQQSIPAQQQMVPGQVVSGRGTAIQPNQQQVYTAQHIPQQQFQGHENEQGLVQLQIDPNTGAVINPDNEDMTVDPNAPQDNGVPGQGMIQEPIHPVDTSKNTTAYNTSPQYQYNMLGQPVHLLPGSSYHTPMPRLPQTLGGSFRGDLGQNYGVKNTMSKTALAGTIPLGAKASRSQLQHIYRQYKASHSTTQQNIRPPPVQGGSISAGNLYVAPASVNAAPPIQQIPVEKVGGDATANNPNILQKPKMQQGMGQVGDSPVTQNAPHGDTTQEKPLGTAVQGKGRNGLQDMAFTTYRGTNWSFHG